MKQVLLKDSGAFLTRVPRPMALPGQVLVKVHYSMISTGTEVAGLRAAHAQMTVPPSDKVKQYSHLAKSYAIKAIKDPSKAAVRIKKIIGRELQGLVARKKQQKKIPDSVKISFDKNFNFEILSAQSCQIVDNNISFICDDSDWGYQVVGCTFQIPVGYAPGVEFQGHISNGQICVGFLNEQAQWIGNKIVSQGSVEEAFVFDAKGAVEAKLVISNAEAPGTRVDLKNIKIILKAPDTEGLPHDECNEVGWNVGYSAVGEVAAVGSGVAHFSVGNLVACGGAGFANHAEYISVPINLVARLPKECDIRAASSTTVGVIALQGVRRATPTLGEKIAVIGLGLIGQITVQLLKANGCKVIGMDVNEERVLRALSLGMDAGNIDQQVFNKKVAQFTSGFGVDATIITAATKSNIPINTAMEITRRKGRVVIVGDVGLAVERTQFYKKEIDLLMSTSYGPGRYDSQYEMKGIDYPYSYVRWTENRNMQAYLELIAEKKLKITALIDKIVPLAEVGQCYEELVQNPQSSTLGVIIEYSQEPDYDDDPHQIRIRGHRKAHQNKINYALIGAGAFGTCMLVPQMAKCHDSYFLRAVVSNDPIRGGNYAKQQHVEWFASDINAILANDEVDLVVIATRHHLHAEQTIAALQAGKHVFVEKPLALTWQELERIKASYNELKTSSILMVGFNRRFSPAMQQLQQILADRETPLMVNYRVNAGYVPRDSWLQGSEGGGRNLGEACHMYDCFRFLSQSSVFQVSGFSIDAGSTVHMKNDNFNATIKYVDGSVANLFYNALGPKQGLPKERVEVFCDGEAYLIDDYKSLIRCSDNKTLWQGEADKGHFNQLLQLSESISEGKDAPISFEEVIEASAVALLVEECLQNNVHEEAYDE